MGLDAFSPEPRRVELRGRVVELLPLRMRQLASMARAVVPVQDELLKGDFAGAISQDYAAMRSVVCIGSGLPVDQLDDLLPDEFVALAMAVIEVNADFFIQRVLPEMRGGAAKMMQKTTDGESSSPISSSTDIPSGNALT